MFGSTWNRLFTSAWAPHTQRFISCNSGLTDWRSLSPTRDIIALIRDREETSPSGVEEFSSSSGAFSRELPSSSQRRALPELYSSRQKDCHSLPATWPATSSWEAPCTRSMTPSYTFARALPSISRVTASQSCRENFTAAPASSG